EHLAPLPDGATSAMLAVDTMREAIALHLRELTEPCRETLSTAAVVGSTFGLATLAAVCAKPAAHLLEHLDEALAARVVERDNASTFTFRHGLVRDVFYKELPIARRVALHEATGAALRATGRAEDAALHEERVRLLLGEDA